MIENFLMKLFLPSLPDFLCVTGHCHVKTKSHSYPTLLRYILCFHKNLKNVKKLYILFLCDNVQSHMANQAMRELEQLR